MRSVYIHIPFCRNICTYCDFCKMYYNDSMISKYLKELENEVSKNYQNDVIKTIYIGGGTPSCLDYNELDHLFKIITMFKLNKNYEFTFECNVEDLNKKFLMYLKNHKVNRLSIGVQSFNVKYLKFMGRNDKVDIYNNIMLAKKYFDNINIDLIYAVGEESVLELQEDLDKFLKLKVSHISIYSLILEDNTILKINNYQEQDNDVQRTMYDIIRKTLKKNNYIQYELSNFSKKRYQSKHNLTYWNNNEYYGFGLGASGFINNKRYSNTKSINHYLKGNYILEEHKISKQENMSNEMILGLRKIKGVSKKTFYKKYNCNIKDIFSTDKLKENKNNFYIAKKYLYVSNEILIDFIN